MRAESNLANRVKCSTLERIDTTDPWSSRLTPVYSLTFVLEYEEGGVLKFGRGRRLHDDLDGAAGRHEHRLVGNDR